VDARPRRRRTGGTGRTGRPDPGRPHPGRPPRPRLATAATAATGAGLLGLLGLLGLASIPGAAGQPPQPTRQTTKASGPVTRRGQIADTATLAGAAYPTGTIAFSVYGPTDPTCSGPPAATSSRAVTGNGSYTSAAYVAPKAGVYRFVARYGGDAANAPAATSCADPGAAVTVSDPPPPILGRSFQVGPLSGQIYVMAAPATRAARAPTIVRLRESRTLPVGSEVYADGGVARITSATSTPGGFQTGDFAAGRFTVLQSRGGGGLTELDLALAHPATAQCAAPQARAAAARPLSRRVLALLRANVAGRFRTRGRFSSATVRGTRWDTVERCDGTLTQVHRGVVVVTDRRRGRTVVLRAGQSYLAPAP
jgi:hypothetical protein